MHELSVSSAIVDTALRHARGQRVRVVTVRVGSMRQVVPESLSFYFEIVTRDTDCDGASLELEIVAAWMRCRGCSHEWDPAPEPVRGWEEGSAPVAVLPVFRCPECERGDAEVIRGDELEVESIEISEREEDACIAPR